MSDESDPAEDLPCSPVHIANKRLAAVAGDLAETAAGLRRAMAEGTVPLKATGRLADYLENLATQMRRGNPPRLEAEPPEPSDVS